MEGKSESHREESAHKYEKDGGKYDPDSPISALVADDNGGGETEDIIDSYPQSASPRVRLMEAKVMDQSLLAVGGDYNSAIDDNIGSIVGDTHAVDMLIKQV